MSIRFGQGLSSDHFRPSRSAASEVSFPENGKASTFRQVRVAGTGLWSATSGNSVLWTPVSCTGLCLLFPNFRFPGGETGSTVGRDQFDA